MSSRFTFPLRFLNLEILQKIVNYYDVQIYRIPLLDGVLLLDQPFELVEPIEYINEIVDEQREVLCEDGLVHMHDTEHTDHIQIYEMTELFKSLKLPYDSLRANELELVCYRPEISSEPFDIPYHPALETNVFPMDVVQRIVSTAQEPERAVKDLLAAFQQFGGSVPPIQKYTDIQGQLFIPLAVRNQNLFM